jgi:diguanylate cyclase (GGDEF)-like protein
MGSTRVNLEPKAHMSSKLQTIRNLYISELPQKINNMRLAWQKVSEQKDTSDLRHLRIMIHSLAGSSGSFGLPHIQQQAEQLEALLRNITFNDKQQQKNIDQHLNLMQETAKTASKINHQSQHNQQENVTFHSQQKRHILIVEDDPSQGDDLAEQLMHYGYEVVLLRDISQLENTLTTQTVNLVLCDIMHNDRENAGFEAIHQLRTKHVNCSQLPVLFLSARDDLEARLKAIRAGGIGYFQKPVNIGSLIDRIEQLISPNTTERQPHVLLVDDDTSLSQYHALLLEEAGIQTWILNDPEKLMDTLRVFSPDLVLMDLYFPNCTGVELAGVIRQQNNYLGVPILFLSIEKEISEHLLAYSSGADDFLTKPINPKHFVPLVTEKIKRFRQLRDMMLHDSLTGAFNHTSIKNLMDSEISRSRREGHNMVVAMLDIDWFKKINDTYGHPAGDRVLRDLSHLLHRRLRHSDSVGRYGGEEFMVVLGNTDINTALQVLDGIREHFAKIVHEESDKQFQVTFSAGIAQLSDFSEGKQLVSAADDALYRAKEAGRNRICLAQREVLE